MKLVATVFFVLFMLACTETKVDEVNFDDIAGEKGKENNNQSASSDTIVNDKPEKFPLITLIDSIDKKAIWKKIDTTMYLDRFGPKTSEKYYVLTEKDSLTFFSFQFADSLRTKNAFFNWLDCFGKNCTSLRVGSSFRMGTRNAYIVVSEKEMLIVESNEEIKEERIRGNLNKKKENENYLYFVNAPKVGKTVWKRLKKGEEVNLIKEKK